MYDNFVHPARDARNRYQFLHEFGAQSATSLRHPPVANDPSSKFLSLADLPYLAKVAVAGKKNGKNRPLFRGRFPRCCRQKHGKS